MMVDMSDMDMNGEDRTAAVRKATTTVIKTIGRIEKEGSEDKRKTVVE